MSQKQMRGRESQAQQRCVLRQDHAVCSRRLKSLGLQSGRYQAPDRGGPCRLF